MRGEEIFFVLQEFRRKGAVYNDLLSSADVGVYHCSHLSDTIQSIPLNSIKNKCYRMPYWSAVEGEEELPLENEYTCCTLLSKKRLLLN